MKSKTFGSRIAPRAAFAAACIIIALMALVYFYYSHYRTQHSLNARELMRIDSRCTNFFTYTRNAPTVTIDGNRIPTDAIDRMIDHLDITDGFIVLNLDNLNFNSERAKRLCQVSVSMQLTIHKGVTIETGAINSLSACGHIFNIHFIDAKVGSADIIQELEAIQPGQRSVKQLPFIIGELRASSERGQQKRVFEIQTPCVAVEVR